MKNKNEILYHKCGEILNPYLTFCVIFLLPHDKAGGKGYAERTGTTDQCHQLKEYLLKNN